MAGGALGLPKYNCLPAPRMRRACTFLSRHSKLGGVVLRAELADLARRLERRDRLAQISKICRGVYLVKTSLP